MVRLTLHMKIKHVQKLQEQHIFSKGSNEVVSKNIMNIVINHMIILEPCVLH